MATREVIIYIRVEASESYIVDKDNNILSSQKHPVIYYTEKPLIKIRPIFEDGTAFSLADLSAYDSWEFAIDNDWDTDTSPPVLEQSATTSFTTEEVVVGSTTFAEVNFLADANTGSFSTDIGTSKELRTGVYAELSAFNSGITQPQLIIQIPFVMRNKLVELSGGTPDAPTSNYYTIPQADAIFEKKLKKTQTTITDDQANNIVLGSTAIYRSFTVEGIIQDTNDNYNRINGYITHDGTNATAYIDQDDMGGALISALSYTADISSANTRLIITAASVGENPILTYGITDYITDNNYTFLPTDLPNLTLWLDANQITGYNDTDSLTTWADAANLYDASGGTSPAYRTNQINSLPAVDFESSSSQYLTVSLTPGTAMTMFVVFKPETIQNEIFIGSTDSSNNSYLGIETATDKLGGGVSTHTYSTILGTTTVSTGTVYLATLRYDGSNVNLGLDGTNEYSDSQASAVSNSQAFYIGALNTDGSPGSYFDGLIAEIIVYNAALSDSNVDNIETYLTNKYNI